METIVANQGAIINELVDHPIVRFYTDEVKHEMAMCECDDCDPCDYEAG